MNTHTYSTSVGRGCIGSCSYCSAGQWFKIYSNEGYKIEKRRNRSVQNVIDELFRIKDDGYTFVFFRDEFLFATIDYLKKFFKLYEEKINLPFWAQFVPNQMLNHTELIEMAVDAGFVATEIGFQSGSDRINREIYNRFIPNREIVEYAKTTLCLQN